MVRLFGALPESGGVRFRALASAARELHVEILSGAAAGSYRLDLSSDGVQERFVEGPVVDHLPHPTGGPAPIRSPGR